MAYPCIHNQAKECDGCGACCDDNEEDDCYCEVCGEIIHEKIYISANGDVVGCDQCIEERYIDET